MNDVFLPALALDCAGTTGWALRMGSQVMSGRQEFPAKKSESFGMRMIRFNNWLQEMLREGKPKVVIYERPFVHPGRPNSAELAYVFTGQVQLVCAQLEIDYVGLEPAALKRFAAGKGNAQKPEMQARAKVVFDHYDPEADDGADEADALLLLHWFECGMPEQIVRKSRQRRKVS